MDVLCWHLVRLDPAHFGPVVGETFDVFPTTGLVSLSVARTGDQSGVSHAGGAEPR